MKKSILLCAVMILALLCSPAVGSDEEYDQIWDSSYFLSTIEIHVTEEDGKVFGVCYVTNPFYGTDTYHFNGTVGKDGHLEAKHHSGHVFVGQMLSDTEAEGEVTLAKRGLTLTLHAVRRE